MTRQSIFTIGYEGKNVDDFINRLKRYNITTLIDVREIPSSRKPGFSKGRLSENLKSANISYIHMKELGSPRELREKLHEDNDYSSFFEGYGKYLDTQLGSVKYLHDEVLSNGVSCIMCMERDPLHCHRKIVAEKIKEVNGNGLTITHI
ncbi:MAG: DUF488 domain-containing protein [Nitrospirota bacterium]